MYRYMAIQLTNRLIKHTDQVGKTALHF
jgi:hypothetical protein